MKITSYLKNKNIPRVLCNNEKQSCEGYITVAECCEVVTKLKKNKSPGLDGLPSEFYDVFFPRIGEFLVQVYNEAFNEGELIESQKRSVLSLIFKKDDNRLLKNYRPISLATTDYKIVAHILANRIKPVLPGIISESQSGYIKGRYIGENIRLVQDVIQYAKKFKKQGILLFLDFQKAFDSIEWEFMWKSLLKYNFGPEFIKWVKTLYVDPIAICKNNGWLSKEISLKRGIRQGCPISALLFIIATDILAENLKQQLRGISITLNNKYKEIKLSQYADDTVLFLKNEAEVFKAIHILKEFQLVAGLKLNVAKTEALYLGDNFQDIMFVAGIQCVTHGSVRCLGIHVGHDQTNCDKLNWETKLSEIEKLLNMWKQRDLTLFGKITIIKMLALPKILHVAQNTVHYTIHINKLKQLFFNFIWPKRDRIKRNTLVAPYSSGGLNRIDVESYFKALKASWFMKIIVCDAKDWCFFPVNMYNFCYENRLLLKMQFNTKLIDCNLSTVKC